MLNRFRDVFASLKHHDVKYVILGGVAAVLAGVPRATCAFATAALTTTGEILAHEISIFKDRVRLDVQTRTPGLSFADAWTNKVERGVRGIPFWIVSRKDLIRSKLAAGGKIDLEDVQSLTGALP